MIITILAILFLILIVGITFFGRVFLFQKPGNAEDVNSEKCSICRDKFPKASLVERQIGDYKMLYFCKKCVEKLGEDGKKLPDEVITKS